MIIIDKMVFNDAKITFKGNALPTYLGAESLSVENMTNNMSMDSHIVKNS